MKTLNLFAFLPVFICLLFLNAHGQTKKNKNPASPPAAYVTKPYADSLKDANRAINAKIDSLEKKTNMANAKIAALKDSLHSATKTKPQTDTTTMNSYKGKSYIFDQNLQINECNAIGDHVAGGTHPVALQGQRFLIKAINKNGDLVISLWIWGLSEDVPEDPQLASYNADNRPKIQAATGKNDEQKLFKQIEIIKKRQLFNFKQYAYKNFTPSTIDTLNDNVRYFLLSKDSLKKYCSEYKSIPKYNITFGVLTTPFKLRFNKFAFSNNLSVGTAVYIQHAINKDWSWGGVFALSLSSVTLDAASTYVHPDATMAVPASADTPVSPLTTSTTRPAFTPSLHVLFSYKTINFILGVGADYINRPTSIATPTNPEAGWIYNGKPWIGIGFGISLFGNNNTTNATAPIAGQTQKP